MEAADPTPVTVSLLYVSDDVAVEEPLHRSIGAQFPELAVFAARTGVEGLSKFHEHRPQLAVVDISSPSVEGRALVAAIRKLAPGTVVIGLADFSDSDCLRNTCELRLERYLLKPVHPMTLLVELERQVEAIQLRARLAAQENRISVLTRAVEQSPSSVLVTGPDGSIEYVNPVFSTISGYSADEVLERNPSLFGSGLTAPEVYADLWRTIHSGAVWRGEVLNRRKNGECYWVSMVVSPLRDPDGKVHFVASQEEITERKLINEEHEATLEFLSVVNRCTAVPDVMAASIRFFEEKSGCGAVGIRLKEGEEYPYYAAHGLSQQFVEDEARLAERTEKGRLILDDRGVPLIGGRCGEVICGRTDPTQQCFTAHGSFWTNSLDGVPLGGGGAQGHICLRQRCEQEGYRSVALIPLSIGVERLGLLQLNDTRQGIFTRHEVEQWERLVDYLAIALLRLRAEQSLKQLNQDLEQRIVERTHSLEVALREQESFSYSVSHDLRAPLRHINSYLAILTDDYGDILPNEAHGILERSRAASHRMSNLIDGILELSKVSRSSLTREVINLSFLAHNACGLLRETEPERTVEFVIKEGLTARGDKLLLQQMMVNLLGNAWKYSAHVPNARIEFGCKTVAGHKTFFIKDNGVGFDMAYKDKLFGEFQRLHGPEYEGTGIGLATVKRIIDRHRGKVWAESKPGEGATFYFTLP